MPVSNLAACLAALLLAAGPGKHMSKAEQNEKAERAASVRAEADALIDASGSRDLFTNETKDGAILIRHKGSNFQCLFNPGGRNELVVTLGERPRGEDIICDGPAMLFHMSYFITRARSGETLDSSFDDAVDTVKARWPDAMTVKVKKDPNQEVLDKIAEQAPPSRTSWYLAKTEGSWVFSRVSVSKVGDWIVTMRASGPVDAQAPAESLTEMLWLTRLMVMVDPKLGGKPVVASAGQKTP